MISGDNFIANLEAQGLDFVTGVPCSFLTPLMNAAISRPGLDYVGATSEGEAVAIASGAWLGGRTGVVMMQNSGLGNAVNPLTSLSHTLNIPCLLIITWRGAPDISDEPQHAEMGRLTAPLLDLLGVPIVTFPATDEEAGAFAKNVATMMRDTRRPVATILPKGRVAPATLRQTPMMPSARPNVQGRLLGSAPPKRVDALREIRAAFSPETGLVATTGFCARELYALGDDTRNLYVVGSMGGASGIGLGAALAAKAPIAVLDGDGAMLMKLGTLATIGAEAPDAFTHILLDNGMHESTGKQATVSPQVDFASMAVAAGYKTVHRADSLKALKEALADIQTAPSPRFVHMRVRPSDWADLPRPSVRPEDVAVRFQGHLTGQAQ